MRVKYISILNMPTYLIERDNCRGGAELVPHGADVLPEVVAAGRVHHQGTQYLGARPKGIM